MKNFTSMTQRVELYLMHRKRSGYTRGGRDTGLLAFAKYIDKKGYKGPLTNELSIEWATASKKKTRSAFGSRLEALRGFAQYYKIIDPKTEIPPLNFYGSTHLRSQPYIYSEKEIYNLIEAAEKFSPINSLKPVTFKYLLGLLLSTGLRISEAIHLTGQDVNLDNKTLTIKETKCHKSRYVPVHKSTQNALNRYILIRDQRVSLPLDATFFINDNGRALQIKRLEEYFRRLCEITGLGKKPRLYDARHTFVCERLLKWYQEGKNVNEMMIYLSTYLGHAKITDTYWYITAVPELMSIVANKFEKFATSVSGDNYG